MAHTFASDQAPPRAALPPKLNVLGCRLSAATLSEATEAVFSLAGPGRPGGYVTFTNAHMLMEARASEAFREVVNGAALACADGAPVAALMNRLYDRQLPRLAGMDMMPHLLGEASRRGVSVFFYGSTDEILDALEAACRDRYPGLKVAGRHSPPFRPLSPDEIEADLERIRRSGAGLVFVALGCPKQERWMASHTAALPGITLLGVGQAFLTVAGLERRLPAPLRAMGLEWAYRLVQDPRRLWRRYLVTNTQFILAAAAALRARRRQEK